jgi:hypothetical protein
MKTETQPEQPVPTDETNPVDAVAQPTSCRMAYKTVLAAVVIGIITISALWMFVIRQAGSPVYEAPGAEPDVQVHESLVPKVLPAVKTDPVAESIGRKLASMSDRIAQGFEVQQTHSSVAKRELAVMTEGIETIKAAMADLVEANQDLGRRINDATSRLDTLTKDVRALKVVKRNPAARHKPRSAKTPPFQLDAIDVWDDATYVAVSQAGRVVFLKAGEQQSGWTVTHIDRLKRQVDFQGPAGQVHSVSLQR